VTYEFENVACGVADVLEAVGTEMNAAEPSRHNDRHVQHVHNLRINPINQTNIIHYEQHAASGLVSSEAPSE